MGDGTGPPARSIGWYRWLAIASFAAAVATFLAAAVAEVSSPGAPANRALFWTAVAVNLSCLVTLPTLLIRAIRFRGLVSKEWRAVMMRAVWGGPFGTLGALWDLCTDPVDPPAPPPPVDSPVATDRGVPDRRSGRQDGGR